MPGKNDAALGRRFKPLGGLQDRAGGEQEAPPAARVADPGPIRFWAAEAERQSEIVLGLLALDVCVERFHRLRNVGEKTRGSKAQNI